MAVTQPTNMGYTTVSSTTTVARSFPTLPAIGSVICVFVSSFDANITTTTVTDNQGHTYTKRYGLDAANTEHQCWTTVVTASSGTFTVTMTRNTNGDTNLAVVEQPGVDTAALLDAQNTATASNTSPTVSATEVAAAVAVLGHLSWDGATFTITDTDARLVTEPNGTTVMPIDIQWRRATGAGAKATSWTLSGAPAAWFAGALLLTEATGGGGPAAKKYSLLGNPFRRLHRGARVG